MIKHIFLATILYTAALHSSTTLNGFFDEEAFDDTSYQLMILQNQAADIKDIFQTFTQIPEKYLHQINVVISELKNIKLSAPQIQNATQALRRYQVLATTCVN